MKAEKQHLENSNIAMYLEKEWKRFLLNYNSENDLEKNFNSLYKRSLYRKSIQICDSLAEQLEELNEELIPKVREIVKNASESAYSSKIEAETKFAHLEFPGDMDEFGRKLADLDKETQNLESSDEQEQDMSNLLRSYANIAQGYESINKEYVKFGDKAKNNRDSLQKAYASLKSTRDELNEDMAKMVMNLDAIVTLKTKTNTLERTINSESSSSLIPKINEIKEEWKTLLSNIEKLKIEREKSEHSHIEWMKKKELLLRYKDQWKRETVEVHRKGEKAEEAYKQLFDDFEFEKAEEISLLWIDNYDKATNQLTGIIKEKAEQFEKECKVLVETLNKIQRHTDKTENINTYNQNYQKGFLAYKQEDYIMANAHFESISKTLPNFIRQLEVKHASEDLIKSLNDNRRRTDEPDDFDKYEENFQSGMTAFNEKDYQKAEQHFGSINKTLPEFINKLKIRHFSDDCESFVKVEKWDELEKFILDWQKELPPDGVEIKNKYLDVTKKGKKKQKCLNDFQNANKNNGFESLSKMEKILDDWCQVADDDLLFKSANNLYNNLKTLNNDIQMKRWKEALNLSLEILNGDAYGEFGKSCGMARNSLDKSITRILDDVKEKATQNGLSLQKQFEAWEKVKSEANEILKVVPQNVKAENCIREVQDEKKRLQRQAMDDWRTAIQEKATYNAIELEAKEKIAFLKANYNTNDNDYIQLLNIMSDCKELHGLVKDLDMKEDNDVPDTQLRKITEKADAILKIINPSVFASACKELIKKNKYTITLPDGNEIVLLPVKKNTGEIFWMSECEITQKQYASLINGKFWESISELNNVTWFGEKLNNIIFFIKRNMKSYPSKKYKDDNFPVQSIDWHEAMAWCEILNWYVKNTNLLKESNYVLRLPTVTEWELACNQEFGYNINNSKTPQNVNSLSINKLGFKGLIGNVSEWSIESVNENDKPYFESPLGFSYTKRKDKDINRIHMGGAFENKTNVDNRKFIFGEKGGMLQEVTIRDAEGQQKTIMRYKQGKTSPEIGFRIVWGPIP